MKDIMQWGELCQWSGSLDREIMLEVKHCELRLLVKHDVERLANMLSESLQRLFCRVIRRSLGLPALEFQQPYLELRREGE